MATEAPAVECPVCGEGFREKPARCFRCESDLELWWPLDESLRALDGVSFPVAAAPWRAVASGAHWARRNAGWLWPVILMAGLVGALVLHLLSTRPPADAPFHAAPRLAPVASPPTPAPAVAPPSAPAARTVRYVVQPGDSLWRIAAALEGDGRRWPELLAAGAAVNPEHLRPGQELLLVVRPLAKPN